MLLLMLSTSVIVANASRTGSMWLMDNDSQIEPRFLTSLIKDDRLYLDVPKEVLDKPMLFVRYRRGSKAPYYLQVMWSLKGDEILLKQPSIRPVKGIILPIKPNLVLDENILAIFPLEENSGVTDKYRIDVTDLLLQHDIEWAPGFSERPVPGITRLLGAKNLDREVVVKIRKGIIKGGSKIALPIFYGFAPLPDPMATRGFDYRMGFSSEGSIDRKPKTHNTKGNINRWRLEKKFSNSVVSVPKQPITLTMSPDIPKKWRPYVRAGVEEWLSAFEAAGFKNAIVVKETDSISEWDRHSIHTSMIKWGRAKYLRGNEDMDFGGTASLMCDLRTGEILRGDIYLGASIQSLSERYFIRAAPLDKRAQNFPFPEELVGALFQRLTAHEAGHFFGLIDSNYGEYGYPIDKMNDSTWLREMGHTPSVMNYTRTNNLPQPEDSISPELLMNKVGPMDRYQIQWAYTEFPKDMDPRDRKAELERMLRWQDSVPWYRFNMSQPERIGPGTTNEVVETNDPVGSASMALKNLQRVLVLLPEAIGDEPDYGRLDRLYHDVQQHWYHHMVHVASLLGGYDIRYNPMELSGNMYVPISMEKQQAALDYLLVNALHTPQWLVEPEFAVKIRYSTFPNEVLAYQQLLLMDMLATDRLKRLEYLELHLGHKGAVAQYLDKVQAGLFQELQSGTGPVDPGRQELQKTYIDRLVSIMAKERVNFFATTKSHDYTDYTKGLMMECLIGLQEDLEHTLKKDKDLVSQGHWQRCLEKLRTLLR